MEDAGREASPQRWQQVGRGHNLPSYREGRALREGVSVLSPWAQLEAPGARWWLYERLWSAWRLTQKLQAKDWVCVLEGGRWVVGPTPGVWAAGGLWGFALPPHHPFRTLPLITDPFPRGHGLQSHLQPQNDGKGPSAPAQPWGVWATGLGLPFGGGRARAPPPAPSTALTRAQLGLTQPGKQTPSPSFTAEATRVPSCVVGPGPLLAGLTVSLGRGGHPLPGPPWGEQSRDLTLCRADCTHGAPSPTQAVSRRRSRDPPSQACPLCSPQPRGQGRGRGPGKSPTPLRPLRARRCCFQQAPCWTAPGLQPRRAPRPVGVGGPVWLPRPPPPHPPTSPATGASQTRSGSQPPTQSPPCGNPEPQPSSEGRRAILSESDHRPLHSWLWGPLPPPARPRAA